MLTTNHEKPMDFITPTGEAKILALFGDVTPKLVTIEELAHEAFKNKGGVNGH